MRLHYLIAAAVLVSSTTLQAQQIILQQPVVHSTGVGTTVSVPDRGTTFLGGVSSAESFRQSYGPLRSGTSRASALSAGSISASVWIIDLHEMDEAILNSVPDSPVPFVLRRRSGGTERDAPRRDEASPAEKAAKFVQLARLAEAAGNSGVAKLHWQMAARHGSAVAREKLNPVAVEPARDAARK